ncbi:MAG: fibronectin type III domain-containing protein [Actinomycetes bacterium]|jgi:hypothetical protein|nr:fibronectin type III domain-containing protein [Actinomycetes bacterium]
MRGERGGDRERKERGLFGVGLSLLLSAALVVPAVVGAVVAVGAWTAVEAYAAPGDAPSTSVNYFAAKFPGLTETNVFDNVTVERLYKGVLGQDGKSVIVLGSARNASTKNTLQYIQAAAAAYGIKKIYYFDPHLAGDAIPGDVDGADITKAASRADLTTGKDIWDGATSSLKRFVSGTGITGGAHLKYIDATYTSDDTYLFVYDRKAGGTTVVDSSATIVSDLLLDDTVPVATSSEQNALQAQVTAVFDAAGWTSGNSTETFYDQYHWFRDSGAWTIANVNPSVADLGITRENFTVKQVTWFEFINILNTPGEHYFFCSGSWCGDSRNLYPYLIQEASRANKTVYLVDFRANNGVGTSVSYFSSESATVKNGIAYIGAKVVDLLDPFDVGETNAIRTYYPGGDTTATLQNYVNQTFRSPYAAKYTKPNSSEQGSITESWVNYDELLEAPYKSSSEWTATVHAPGAKIDYEVQTGGINALQTAKAREHLAEFFGAANIHTTSGYSPTTSVSTNVSKSDSGCGDENDLLDDVGGEKLIPNQGTDDIDVQNYDISIEYDSAKAADKDSITGETVVTAIAQKNLTRIELDFKALAVDKPNVSFALGDATGDASSYASVGITNPTTNITQANNDDEDYQKLIVRLPVTVPAGAYFKLTVPYTTGILDNFVADGESAQGFFKRVDNKGVAAIGEPLGAIYWFPNNNTPKDGATYKITLKYPSGFSGVGPGVRTAVSATTSTWQVSRDIASYQAFASIGEYVELSALVNRANNNSASYQQYITLSQPTSATRTVWSGSNEVGYEPTADDVITAGPNGSATTGSNGSTKVINTALPFYAYVNKGIFFANNSRAADKANAFTHELPAYIQTLESIIGPYPGESAGFVFDNLGDGQGGSASWGAVETKDRPFFTGSNITSERTFVHEYAHQWYGNAVRIEGWEDLWLNEGFATYVTDLYYEATQGFDVQAKYRNLYQNTGSSKPWWNYAPAAIETEGDLFGGASAAYNRGALALAALREAVGDSDFFAILQGWVATYAGQAVNTGQFVDYAADAANVDLTEWSDTWLTGQVKPAAWQEPLPENGTVIPSDGDGDGGGGGTVKPPADTTPQTTVVSLASAKIAGIANRAWTGKAVKPAVTITLGGKTLVAGRDYTVSYRANTAVGTARVTVSGTGGYKDSVSATFKIVPARAKIKSAKAGVKKVTLKWTPAKGGLSKQVVYWKLKSAKKWKKVTVSAKTKSRVFKKLKAGKKYQFKVTGYKTVKGVKYTSVASTVKTVKIKK